MTNEIEIPEDLAILNQAVDAATDGTITYLMRDGRRLAALIPAELAELLLPGRATDADPGRSADKSRRRLELLARVQGVEPSTDPDELRGPEMSEEEARAFHAAVVAGRTR
jgi:hypothetical protein